MADTKKTERELRKKQREINLCAIVARTINELENTDYIVRGPEHQIALCKEPADVLMESKSGAHPTRQVQVVTIPSNDHLEMRDDNGNVSRFENRLKNILIQRKMRGFEVQVSLTAEAVLHGIPAQAVNQIADLIQSLDVKDRGASMTPRSGNIRRMLRSTYRMYRGGGTRLLRSAGRQPD